MDWASRKKLTFLAALAVIVIGGALLLIFPLLNRPATCSDKKKNGQEAGVDCGGACQYLCQEQVVPLELVWTRALLSGPKRVNLVAYLRNENKTAGVQKASYKFTVYDNKGDIVVIKEGTTDVAANGNIAIFSGPVDVGERKVQSTTFEWTSPLYFSTLSEKSLTSKIETVDTKLDKTEATTHLYATLRNTTRLEYRAVPVVVILYNKEDNAVLVSRTVLDRLLPEEKTDISFSWNLVLEEDIAKIEVLPYFGQFN